MWHQLLCKRFPWGEFDQYNKMLARYSHSQMAPDDILSVDLSTDAVSLGMAKSAGAYYFIKDTVGSVIGILDNSGNIIQQYEYSAFGRILSIKNKDGLESLSDMPVKVSCSYTGREFEPEGGLYYYRARYYDPSIGRFLQRIQTLEN